MRQSRSSLWLLAVAAHTTFHSRPTLAFSVPSSSVSSSLADDRQLQQPQHHVLSSSTTSSDIPATTSSSTGFAGLLDEDLIDRLRSQLGITEPNAIQAEALRVFYHEPSSSSRTSTSTRPKSILVCSQTGSGKTMTFLLPLLQLLRKDPTAHALVVAPTHLLLDQHYEIAAELDGEIASQRIHFVSSSTSTGSDINDTIPTEHIRIVALDEVDAVLYGGGCSDNNNNNTPTPPNQKKLLFGFASRAILEAARRDIKERWNRSHRGEYEDHDPSLRTFDDPDFSESRRGGDDYDNLLSASGATFLDAVSGHPRSVTKATVHSNRRPTEPSTTPTTALKNGATPKPAATSQEQDGANGSPASTVATNASTLPLSPPLPTTTDPNHNNNNNNRSDHSPILQVLPHHQLLLPRGPQGHWVLDFARFPETQHIQVTPVSHDFQQDGGRPYLLSLDRPSPAATATRQQSSTNDHDDVEALQSAKLQALQQQQQQQPPPSSSSATTLRDGDCRSQRLVVVVVGCFGLLLVAILVLVVLSVTLWRDVTSTTTTIAGGDIFRDDDFYAGYNNINNAANREDP